MANITFNPNAVIALSNEEAHKLMQDPTFLQQAVANPLLLKAAMVAQGLTPATPEQQRVIDAQRLVRARNGKIAMHAKRMGTALRDALAVLDNDMAVPLSGFIEKQMLSGAIYTCRQQYFWGVWNANRAQREISNFNLEGGQGSLYVESHTEEYQQAPLKRAEALLEFHTTQCEQYELVLQALFYAWQQVDKELHEAAKAAENVSNQPYMSPVAAEVEKGSRFTPNIDTSMEAYAQWNENRERQYRSRRQQSEQAADAANMTLLKGSSNLFNTD
jgi:hypothetical protein